MEIRNFIYGTKLLFPAANDTDVFYPKNIGRVSLTKEGLFIVRDSMFWQTTVQFQRSEVTAIFDNNVPVAIPGTDEALYDLLASYLSQAEVFSPNLSFTVNTLQSINVIPVNVNNYNTTVNDNGGFIFWTNAPADRTFNIPLGLPIGWTCRVYKINTGNTITFAPAVGVTIEATQTVMSAQYAVATLVVRAANIITINYAPDKSVPILLIGANNYNTSAADKGAFAYWNPPSADRTFNIPLGLPVGWNIKLYKLSTGNTITITAAVGVTLNGNTVIAAQYAIANIMVVAPNVVMVDVSPDPTIHVEQLGGNNYNTIIGDDGFAFTYNAAANKTFTIPLGLPVGWNCRVFKNFAGNSVTIAGAGGVTLNGTLVMNNAHSMCFILVVAPNVVQVVNTGL